MFETLKTFDLDYALACIRCIHSNNRTNVRLLDKLNRVTLLSHYTAITPVSQHPESSVD